MNKTVSIRVLIVDGSAIFRQGLQFIIDGEPNMQVVAQVDNARDAVTAYEQHRPDVTLLDLRTPETECANAIKAIRAQNPQARIIIVTSYDGEEDIVRGLRAGAGGYLLKDASPQQVIETIRAVYAGKKWVAPEIASKLADHAAFAPLSESELAVLRQMAEGRSNLQIADALTVSESAVKFHVNNILFKLAVANRTQAVVIALKRGLVRLDS